MRANRRSRCVRCPVYVEPGEEMITVTDGYAHASCPEMREPEPTPDSPPLKATESQETVRPTICTACGLPGHDLEDCERLPVADYAARAAEVRTLMGWSEEGEPFVTTPFRERFGLPPRTEGQLRAMAREQVAESRAGRLVTVGHEDGYEIRQAREQDAGHDADAPAGG